MGVVGSCRGKGVSKWNLQMVVKPANKPRTHSSVTSGLVTLIVCFPIGAIGRLVGGLAMEVNRREPRRLPHHPMAWESVGSTLLQSASIRESVTEHVAKD